MDWSDWNEMCNDAWTSCISSLLSTRRLSPLPAERSSKLGPCSSVTCHGCRNVVVIEANRMSFPYAYNNPARDEEKPSAYSVVDCLFSSDSDTK